MYQRALWRPFIPTERRCWEAMSFLAPVWHLSCHYRENLKDGMRELVLLMSPVSNRHDVCAQDLPASPHPILLH